MVATVTADKNERFRKLLDSHGGIVYKVCYMYASSPDHFQDLRQDVLANVWQGLDSFRGESADSTWLYRVALNTCVSNFRHNRRHASDTMLDRIPDIADESDEHTQLLRQMYELIASLDKLDKALIMLWLDEYPYDEIARITGLSRANVASRLHRARQKLIKKSNE